MKVLRLKRATESKVELATLLYGTYCLLSKIPANTTDLTVLAYLSVYGFKRSTKDLIIKSQILRSYNSLENTITRLRKMGLVIKDNEGFTRIAKGLDGIIENRMGLIIDLFNV